MATKKATDTAAKKATPTATKAAAKTATKAPAKTPSKKSASADSTVQPSAGKHEPTHAEISHLAHQYWQERGHNHGSHEDDWVRAERELKSR